MLVVVPLGIHHLVEVGGSPVYHPRPDTIDSIGQCQGVGERWGHVDASKCGIKAALACVESGFAFCTA